jgi:three-Cys-motif partner protein
MPVPKEYEGREQSYLKHEVLKHYLSRWGTKLASIGRTRRVKLWFVDCFAGPWEAQSTELSDTSIAIGLSELKTAAAAWKNAAVEVGALFVESDKAAFQRLSAYLAEHSGNIDTHAWNGEFGAHVDDIDRRIGSDPAFLFVDPTGWNGAAMKYIAPLAKKRFRDVLVNVMTGHVLRFHHDRREALRAQMQSFFGLESDASINKLDEEALITFYRERLKLVCGLSYAADLAVPHPTDKRTKFRLVVGGHDKEVMRVFREAEEKVIGHLAAEVREEAKRKKREVKSRALEFSFGPPAAADERYEDARERGEAAAEAAVLAMVARAPLRFEEVWPVVLESQHLTVAGLGSIVANLQAQGRVVIDGWTARKRKPDDGQLIRLAR